MVFIQEPIVSKLWSWDSGPSILVSRVQGLNCSIIMLETVIITLHKYFYIWPKTGELRKHENSNSAGGKYDDPFYLKHILKYFCLQGNGVDILFSIPPTRYF